MPLLLIDGRAGFGDQMLDLSVPSPGWDGGKQTRVRSCEQERTGAYSSGLSFSGSFALFRRGEVNFIQGGDLRCAAHGRPQRTITAVSSSIAAAAGPVVSRNWLRDIVAVLPPNSFTVCMPKY